MYNINYNINYLIANLSVNTKKYLLKNTETWPALLCFEEDQ